MKRYSMLAIFILSISLSEITLNASEIKSQNPDTYTTVTSGRCVNMKRDHKYQTTSWSPYKNAGYVKVINCENDPTADGYSGKIDALIEQSSTGRNWYKKNDAYLAKGSTFYHEEKGLPSEFKYVSTADWEVIDGQDTSGNKVIFSSVE